MVLNPWAQCLGEGDEIPQWHAKQTQCLSHYGIKNVGPVRPANRYADSIFFKQAVSFIYKIRVTEFAVWTHLAYRTFFANDVMQSATFDEK